MCKGSDSQYANISFVLVEVVGRQSRGITSVELATTIVHSFWHCRTPLFSIDNMVIHRPGKDPTS